MERQEFGFGLSTASFSLIECISFHVSSRLMITVAGLLVPEVPS